MSKQEGIQSSLSTAAAAAAANDEDYDVASKKKKHLLLSQEIQKRRVVGDTVKIKQVLRNLMSNAIKFTPEHGTIEVQLSWRKPQLSSPPQMVVDDLEVKYCGESVSLALSRCGELEMSVTDSGAGMSEDQVQNVFESGIQFNVNELQAGQGSGLGLYIAKGITEQHGGTLTASSQGFGRGTTFTMTLPLHHVPDTEMPPLFGARKLELKERATTKNHHRRPLTSRSSWLENIPNTALADRKSLRILVVEDVASNRKILVRLLRNRGHVCDEAVNGLEAFKCVQGCADDAQYYDVILMDYEMPVMDGPSSAKAIRASHCNSLIVGITGNILPDDVSYFKACGANAVLPKPAQMPALEELFREYGVMG